MNYKNRKRKLIIISSIAIIVVILSIFAICQFTFCNINNTPNIANLDEQENTELKTIETQEIAKANANNISYNFTSVGEEKSIQIMADHNVDSTKLNYSIMDQGGTVAVTNIRVSNGRTVIITVKALKLGSCIINVYEGSQISGNLAMINVSVGLYRNVIGQTFTGTGYASRVVPVTVPYNLNGINVKARIDPANNNGVVSIQGVSVVTGTFSSDIKVTIKPNKVGKCTVQIYNGDMDPLNGMIAIINCDIQENKIIYTNSNNSNTQSYEELPQAQVLYHGDINLKPGETFKIGLDWIDRFDWVYTDNTSVATYKCDRASDNYFKELEITANSDIKYNTWTDVGLDNYGNRDWSNGWERWRVNVYADTIIENPTNEIHIKVGETKEFKIDNATYYKWKSYGTENCVKIDDSNSQILKITGNKVGTTQVTLTEYGNPKYQHTNAVYKIVVDNTPKITAVNKSDIEIMVGDTVTRTFKPTNYASLYYHFNEYTRQTSDVVNTKAIDTDNDGAIDSIQVTAKKAGSEYLSWEARDTNGDHCGAYAMWKITVKDPVSCTITPKNEYKTYSGMKWTKVQNMVYNIKFSEEVEGFTQSDVIVNGGGTITAFNKVSNKEWNVTVTNPDGADYYQTISIAKAACYKKGQSAITNKNATLSMYVDRVAPVIKNIRVSSSDNAGDENNLKVSEGIILTIKFDVEDKHLSSSSTLSKNNVQFVNIAGQLTKTFKPDTVSVSGNTYTIKCKIPEGLTNGTEILFQIPVATSIADIAGNTCRPYISNTDSSFRKIMVDDSATQISNITYHPYNGSTELTPVKDNTVFVGKSNNIIVETHYSAEINSTKLTLKAGNGTVTKGAFTSSASKIYVYQFSTSNSELEEGEIRFITNETTGKNGKVVPQATYLEDSNGIKIVLDKTSPKIENDVLQMDEENNNKKIFTFDLSDNYGFTQGDLTVNNISIKVGNTAISADDITIEKLDTSTDSVNKYKVTYETNLAGDTSIQIKNNENTISDFAGNTMCDFAKVYDESNIGLAVPEVKEQNLNYYYFSILEKANENASKKSLNDMYYVTTGDKVRATIKFNNPIDGNQFDTKLGNAVGNIVEGSGANGLYYVDYTIGDEEEGTLKFYIENWVDNEENDNNNKSIVFDHTSPTIENAGITAYGKDSLAISFEVNDNYSLTDKNLTSGNITIKIGDTVCDTVYIKKITQQVVDTGDANIRNKKYDIIVNNIEAEGEITLIIDSILDAAGNSDTYQNVLGELYQEDAKINGIEFSAKRNGEAISGTKKFMRKDDELYLKVTFNQKLKKAPVIEINGEACEVEKEENDASIYNAKYVFSEDEENQIDQGAILLGIRNIVSIDEEIVEDYEKTIDNIVYDSIQPEITNFDVLSSLNNSKATIKFNLADDNLDDTVLLNASNFQITLNDEEKDAEDIIESITKGENNEYTVLLSDVKYAQLGSINIQSSEENQIIDKSGNELINYFSGLYYDDDEAPTLEISTNKELDENTTDDIILTITASDEKSGIKNVTVNGNIVDLENGVGEYTISNNGVYKIIATDNAGNTFEKEIEVNNLIKNIGIRQSLSGYLSNNEVENNNNDSNSNGNNSNNQNNENSSSNSDSNSQASEENSTSKSNNQSEQKTNENASANQKDGVIPHAGLVSGIVIAIIAAGTYGIISYKKYRKL